MNVTELQFKLARCNPGDRVEYYTGLTGWGLLRENLPAVLYFKTLHDSGEWDFVQENLGYIQHTNYQTFRHYAVRRKEKRNGF